MTAMTAPATEKPIRSYRSVDEHENYELIIALRPHAVKAEQIPVHDGTLSHEMVTDSGDQIVYYLKARNPAAEATLREMYAQKSKGQAIDVFRQPDGSYELTTEPANPDMLAH